MDQTSMQDAGAEGAGAHTPVPVATRVDAGRRFDFLYRQLHTDFIRFESLAFMHLGNASEDYQGGTWEFYALSNGGFYMAPNRARHVSICLPG